LEVIKPELDPMPESTGRHIASSWGESNIISIEIHHWLRIIVTKIANRPDVGWHNKRRTFENKSKIRSSEL
jgi:hypothetical protein